MPAVYRGRADSTQAEIADPTTDSRLPSSHSTVPRNTSSGGVKPTRKVVDPPGGKQSLKIYGEEYEEEDALSLAPPRDGGPGVDVEVERLERMRLHVEPELDGGAKIEEQKEGYVQCILYRRRLVSRDGYSHGRSWRNDGVRMSQLTT